MTAADTAPVRSKRQEETPVRRGGELPTTPHDSQALAGGKTKTVPNAGVVERRKRDRRSLGIVFLLLAVISLVGGAALLLPKAPTSPWLKAHLHSILFADYSAQLGGAWRPAIGLGLLADFLNDNGLPGDGLEATMQAGLLTPIPSVTPLPGTVYPTATVRTPTPTATASPAGTGTATATRTMTATVTPTGATPLPRTPTATRRATTTDSPWEPTDPVHPPTATSQPTEPLATPTYRPPTATLSLPTVTPQPTATSIPYPYP